VAYLTSMETDEARPLRFTLCCTPAVESLFRHNQNVGVEVWPFAADRPFTVQEIRRLAAATDLDTSAIWLHFPQRPDASLSIHGILSLGSSWADARNAFAYQYEPLPEALLVRVPAPGQVEVYQGQLLIASLQSGRIQAGELPSPVGLLGAYPLFEEGHRLLRQQIAPPRYQETHLWQEAEWLAYVNTVLGVVNEVQWRGHGGALIFASKDCRLIQDRFVKIKYALSSQTFHLKERFIELMNLRHRLDDMLWVIKTGDDLIPGEEELSLTALLMQNAQRRLAETCHLVGDLSGTDGAIVMRTDLSVAGFGTEIRLEAVKPAAIYKVTSPIRRDREEFDSEQFGMRHRSAMRLCSALPDLVIFVVSQDGGVSLVWNEDGEVCFKPGINTANANMVFVE
jgi:hypothetical protein